MSKKRGLLKQANRAMREGRFGEARELYESGRQLPNPLGRICEQNLRLLDRLGSFGSTTTHDAEQKFHEVPQKKEHAAASPDDSFRVDVIVPVYNAIDHAKKCLEDLRRCSDGFEMRTIVVNDGSEEHVRDWLRDWSVRGSSRTLVEHKTNRGYTRAVNSGIRASGAEFLVLLNSDTRVTPGWLQNCLRCMFSIPDVGLVGPLSNAASWQSIPSIHAQDGSGFAVNPIPAGISLRSLAKVVSALSERSYPEVTFLNGFCLVFRRSVIDSIGLFDEEAFPTGYGEENDFCIRAHDAGFKLAIADDAFVFHAKSKSFGHDKRIELSRLGGEALRKKHGADRISRGLKITEDAVNGLSPLRSRIKAFFGQPRRFKRVLEAPETTDPIIYSPKPAFGERDFNLEPAFSGPAVVLPFDSDVNLTPGFRGKSVAIHLHLHYPDLLDEFLSALANIPVPFDLYVSITEADQKDRVASKAGKLENLDDVVVEVVGNRGRDIAPLVVTFGSQLSGYDLICHVHGKRSPHNLSKRDWRRQLVHGLMGSTGLVASIFNLFADNPSLGMVFPEYHWSLRHQIGWGTNYEICENIAAQLGVPISPLKMQLFPAGSMFWARGNALTPIWRRGFRTEDFPAESGQIDGTPAHAMERLFGEVVVHSGYHLLQIAPEKPHNLRHYFPRKWPYPPVDSKTISSRVSAYSKERKSQVSRIPVFTAITGGYEQPLVHETLDPWIDFILFSDNEMPSFGCWEVRRISQSTGDPLVDARLIKASADKLFPDAELAIWIDGNVLIRNSLASYRQLVQTHPEYPIFGIPHPVRICAYAEAEKVIVAGKASEEAVKRQMNRYQEEGFPTNHGLIETNFLIFNLRHPELASLLNAWRRELIEETRRDQLSINYVLWKNNLSWFPIMDEGRSLRDHQDFAYMGHGRNSGYCLLRY